MLHLYGTFSSLRHWLVGIAITLAGSGCADATTGRYPSNDERDQGDKAIEVFRGEGTLPLEVFGAAQESVAIHVPDGTTPEQLDDLELRLRVHGLDYQGKAEVNIQDRAWSRQSTWLPLTHNRPVHIEKPDLAYGGMGGGFATIRLRVDLPATMIQPGVNKVAFRFRGIRPNGRRDGKTIGYRVLSVELASKADGVLVSRSTFRQDDPATWKATVNGLPATAQDVARGKGYWFDSTLIADPTRPTKKLGARCFHCHVDNGFDLAYFNYSNRSIVERSMFHGLSRIQGERIAAYIRSLTTSKVVPYVGRARPWAPPYQPGPGTTARGSLSWAAGAGLDAVLPADAPSVVGISPTATQAEVNAAVSITGNLSIRDRPIAIQFPDWNRWLPEVHPIDIWGLTAYQQELAPPLTKARGAVATLFGGPLFTAFDEFPASVVRFLRPEFLQGTGDGWAQNGAPLTARQLEAKRAGFSPERAKQHLAKWGAVKQFELAEGLNLTERAKGAFSEPLQYPTNRYTVFHLAPHYIGDERGTGAFIGQDLTIGAYESSMWYQVQLTINPGQNPGVVEPVDWSYSHQWTQSLGNRSGTPEPFRYYQVLIKNYQMRNRPYTTSNGWTMREVSPWRIYWAPGRSREKFNATLGTPLRLFISNALLRQFLNKVESFQVSDWTRIDPVPGTLINTWAALETANYTPTLAKPGGEMFGTEEADNMLRLLNLFKGLKSSGELVVDCQLRRRLSNWSAKFWPKGTWDAGC